MPFSKAQSPAKRSGRVTTAEAFLGEAKSGTAHFKFAPYGGESIRLPAQSRQGIAGGVEMKVNGAFTSTMTFVANKDKTPPDEEAMYSTYYLFDHTGSTSATEVLQTSAKLAHDYIYNQHPEKFFVSEVAQRFKDGSLTPPELEYAGGDGIKFNLLEDNSGLVATELFEEKIRPGRSSRKVLPPSYFHMPAKVKLECIVSVYFKADTCRGMVSCKRAFFIKPLAFGSYKQLNELPEEPESDAEFFLDPDELESAAVAAEAEEAAATAAGNGGAAAAATGKQKQKRDGSGGGGRAQKKAKTGQ
jgi:hypothetical protein